MALPGGTTPPLHRRSRLNLDSLFIPGEGSHQLEDFLCFTDPFLIRSIAVLKTSPCISRGTFIPRSTSDLFNSYDCFLQNRSLYLHHRLHGIQTILLSWFVPNRIGLLSATPGNNYYPVRSFFYFLAQTMYC